MMGEKGKRRKGERLGKGEFAMVDDYCRLEKFL
jgi:hypothetical protein